MRFSLLYASATIYGPRPLGSPGFLPSGRLETRAWARPRAGRSWPNSLRKVAIMSARTRGTPRRDIDRLVDRCAFELQKSDAAHVLDLVAPDCNHPSVAGDSRDMTIVTRKEPEECVALLA